MSALGGGGGEGEAGRTCTDHGNVERLGGGLVGEQLCLVPDDDRNPCQSVALDEHQQRTQRQSVALSGNQWHSMEISGNQQHSVMMSFGDNELR